MAIELTAKRLAAFDAVLPALSAFKRAFGRDVAPDFLAELYVAKEFKLQLSDRKNEPGADATDEQGRRYQIKYRSPSTQNVDINNFDFDYIVLVNLGDDYGLAGLWRLTVEQVRAISSSRPDFGKFQITQARFKSEAVRALKVAAPSA